MNLFKMLCLKFINVWISLYYLRFNKRLNPCTTWEHVHISPCSWKLGRRICRKRVWFTRKVSISHSPPPSEPPPQLTYRVQLRRHFPHLHRSKLFHCFHLHPGRQKLRSLLPPRWVSWRISGPLLWGRTGPEITPAPYWPCLDGKGAIT